ncbi:MAG TPA: calcium-binding protein [Solirubrobacteraceae bacterium]
MARRLFMHGSARRITALLGAGISVLAFASSAAAATSTPFGCRASTARVSLLGALVTEPTVANPNTTPCATNTAGAATVSLLTSGDPGVEAGPVGAFTYSVFSASGGTAPGASAVAAVQGVTIPTGGTGFISVVGPVQAMASYSCVNDQLVATASSTLDLLDVNGQNMSVPAGSPETIQLGGGSYIAVNEEIKTSNSLTERVLDVHLAGLADVVVGEAEVTQSVTDPCAGTEGQPPPVLEICPPGSTLNIAAQLCEIVTPGGVIVVSRPFQGPSGGTVYPTGVVAKKYPGYPCTTGPGPKFALVATKRGGRVYGTPKSDRILALGAYERIAGEGGNDCLNGNGGNQVMFDGNGNDKDYTAAGFNRIAVGNGNDYINARTGRVWITAGNGHDTVIGGKGRSRIDVGLGKDHVYGGPSKNRVFAGANGAKVSCGSGHNNTAFVRTKAEHYAKTHGCQHIHLLH